MHTEHHRTFHSDSGQDMKEHQRETLDPESCMRRRVDVMWSLGLLASAGYRCVETTAFSINPSSSILRESVNVESLS